jgi:cytoskeletal protein RodZ
VAGVKLMTETFTRKKVESLTLGEKLSKFRSEARLSIADMAKATKIQGKYIEALERGQYEKLPADVYVRGYLRSYARYLNIDESALVRLYEQERNISSNIRPETPLKNVFATSTDRTYTVSPRSLVIAAIALIVLSVAVYLWFQFRQFTTDPLLSISEPNPNQVIEGNTAVLRGKTDRGTQITVNNEATFVSPEGNFEENLTLQNGVNQITVRAVNRFNKERVEVLQLEARYEEAPVASSEDLALQQAEAEGLFRISLSIKETPTKVKVVADGNTIFDEILGTGDPKIFEAKEKLEISAENGAEVLVKTSSAASLAPLSDKEGPVQSKVFEKDTENSQGNTNQAIIRSEAPE